ncbi:MAG TPA: radical SAM protein [Candidatus Mcinerneyibacterium sp.]|nr:radical SAM protein [Candidatus Mcinerneyibacterium sp.]
MNDYKNCKYNISNEYKLSRYNVYFKYSDFNLLYNTLHDSLLKINDKTYKYIKKNGENLKKIDDEKKNILIDNGFIINKGINEINFVKDKYLKSVYDNKSYVLIINPTMDCNFNCWYCYENHKKSKMSPETIQNVKKFIKNLITKKDISNLIISWFGGEPLLYNDIIYEISKEAKKVISNYDNKILLNDITTNGFLINEKIIEKFKECNFKRFQITLDGYKTKHNKNRKTKNGENTYNTIIKNIKSLINNDFKVCLRINYTEEILEDGDIEKIANDFKDIDKKNLEIDLQKVWQIEHTKKMYDLFDKSIDDIRNINKNINITQSYQLHPNQATRCYGDKMNQAVVNYDGYVFKCTNVKFDKKNSIGKLTDSGIINWDENKMLKRKRFIPPFVKFEKCIACKLLPLCLGPCSEMFLRKGDKEDFIENYCPKGKSPKFDLKNLVKNQYYEKINN